MEISRYNIIIYETCQFNFYNATAAMRMVRVWGDSGNWLEKVLPEFLVQNRINWI